MPLNKKANQPTTNGFLSVPKANFWSRVNRTSENQLGAMS